MDQRRVPPEVTPVTAGDGIPPLTDILRRVEGSCYQAQEWIRQAVKILGQGHHMLALPDSLLSPGRDLPRSLHLSQPDPPFPELTATANPLDDNLPRPTGYSLDKDASSLFPLRVHCLGKFRVYRHGRLVEGWRSKSETRDPG